MAGPYELEVDKFVASAWWLRETDSLMLLHLRTIAQSLDTQLDRDGAIQSALANTFGVTLRSLENRKGKAEEESDADEDLDFA